VNDALRRAEQLHHSEAGAPTGRTA
jgi:hypothetical protein